MSEPAAPALPCNHCDLEWREGGRQQVPSSAASLAPHNFRLRRWQLRAFSQVQRSIWAAAACLHRATRQTQYPLAALSVVLGLLAAPALTAAQPAIAIPDDTVFTLQRGGCEVMECPVYRVMIFADGDVVWQGHARVAKRGVAEARIERDQIRALIQEFQSADYFRIENIYGFRGDGCASMTPFTPMVLISLSMGGLSKTLSHHDGCVGEISQKLTALENSIDRISVTGRWITGKQPHKK